MVKEGLINLDFADVRAVMRGMGKAMMGTGEASGEDRARHAAEAAIANPLLDDVSMHGARGLLISITGGPDLTLYEVDEAASRIREEVDADCQHHPRRDLRPEARGHHPRLGGRDRHRRDDGPGARAGEGHRTTASRSKSAASAAPQVEHQPLQLEPAFESQVEAAVAEAITSEPRSAQPSLSDDGIVVEPYIADRPSRCPRRAGPPRRSADSQRLRALPAPSVRTDSGA